MTEKQIQNKIWSNIPNGNCTLPNFTPFNWWECDLCNISKSGYLTEYEIKTSKSDYYADFKKRCSGWRGTKCKGKIEGKNKHDLLRDKNCLPKHFYFVVKDDMEGLDFPEYCGIIVISENGYIQKLKNAPALSRNKVCHETITKMQSTISRRYWMNRIYGRDSL